MTLGGGAATITRQTTVHVRRSVLLRLLQPEIGAVISGLAMDSRPTLMSFGATSTRSSEVFLAPRTAVAVVRATVVVRGGLPARYEERWCGRGADRWDCLCDLDGNRVFYCSGRSAGGHYPVREVQKHRGCRF